MPFYRILHLAAFVVPWTAFTVLLIVPNPVPELIEEWTFDWAFLRNKLAHGLGYAYLASVGYLYPRQNRYRWAAVAFMILHGVGTETIQALVPELHRHGCIQDVLIDWTGVGVGVYVALLISRRYFSENPSRPV